MAERAGTQLCKIALAEGAHIYVLRHQTDAGPVFYTSDLNRTDPDLDPETGDLLAARI